MNTFYSWLTRSDGIATFNHPGDKSLSTDDPGFNWNDFAYVPAADDQMVGIEVYNSAKDYGLLPARARQGLAPRGDRRRGPRARPLRRLGRARARPRR